MANNRLQLEVEVDSSGAIRGLQVVQQAVSKVNDETKKVGTDAGFDKFANSVKSFIADPLATAGDAAKSLLTQLGPMGTGVAATAGAMTALFSAGYSAAKSLGELGDRIGDTAVRMGLTTKEVGQFNFAMKMAGSEGIGALEPAMKKLSQALDEGSAEGKKARTALFEMGVVTRDASGNLRPMSQIFEELSLRLNSMTDTAKRNSAAIAVLGRAGLEVLPDLLELSSGLARARQLGIGPSQDDVDRWGRYQRQLTEVDAAWERLKRKFKEPLAASVMFLLRDSSGNAVSLDDLAKRGYSIGASNIPRAATQSEFNTAAAQMGFKVRPDVTQQMRLEQAADEFARLQVYGEAAAKKLAAAAGAGLESAQQKLEDLKQKYDAARVSAEAMAAAGKVMPEAANEQLRILSTTQSAYERQKALVESITKAESDRKAIIEEIAKLQERNAVREGFTRILESNDRTIAAGTALQTTQSALLKEQGIPAALSQYFDLAGRPNITRPQQLDIFMAMLPKITQEMDAAFAKINKSLVKAETEIRQTRVEEPFAGSLPQIPQIIQQQTIAGIERRIQSTQSVGEFAVRATEITALPNQQQQTIAAAEQLRIATAQQIFDLTKQRIDYELQFVPEEVRGLTQMLQMTQARGDLQRQVDEAAKERQLQLLDLQRQRFDATRNETERLLHTAFTNPANFGAQFATTIRDAALKPIETSLATTITAKIQPVIFGQDGAGGINGFLGGLFGQKADPLKAATDANTGATVANTQALTALRVLEKTGADAKSFDLTKLSLDAAPIDKNSVALNANVVAMDRLTQAISSMSTSAFSAGSAGKGFSGLTDQLGLPVASGLLGAFGQIPGLGSQWTASGATDQLGLPVAASILSQFGPRAISTIPSGFSAFTRGLGGALTGANAFRALTGGDYSIQTGSGSATTASAQGLTGAAGRAGVIIGAAGEIYAGTMGVISGIRQGGGRGTLNAIAAGAGTAAALDPEPISKAVLMAVALGSSMVASIMGDPKQIRSEAINRELESARYTTATAQTYTMDTAGNAIDYSYSGGVRTTNVHNWNVSTMDAASFSTFLSRNGGAVANTVVEQMPLHGPLQQQIRSTVSPY